MNDVKIISYMANTSEVVFELTFKMRVELIFKAIFSGKLISLKLHNVKHINSCVVNGEEWKEL